MQRKFVSNLIFLLFLNLLVKPFWIFGIEVTVQNRVGAAEYGLFYSLLGFSILFNILLDVGITNYNNRNIAQHDHMLGRYFSSIMLIKFLLGVVYFLITLFAAFVIGYSGRQLNLLLFLTFNQFLVSLILYLRSNIAGLHLFKIDSGLSVTDRLLMIVFCGWLLWGQEDEHFKIEWFVYAQTLAYSITASIAFLLVLWKAKSFRIQLKWPLLWIIVKQSLPYALLILLMAFYYRLDAVMIERLLPDGKFQAGLYAQAYRLLEAATMIGYLFAGLLLPMFSRMIKKKQAIQPLVRLSFNLILIPALTLAAWTFYYAKPIMDLLYVENIDEAAYLLTVLMICFVAISITYIYGTLLTANGSLKQLNRIAISGLGINLILNLVLIPQYQAVGAAIATLITQWVVVILQLVISKRIFQFKSDQGYYLRLFFYFLGLMIAAYLVQLFVSDYLIACILIGFISLILATILGIVRYQDVLKFAKLQ